MDTPTWIKAYTLTTICIITLAGVLVDGFHYPLSNCEDSPGSLGVSYNTKHSAICSYPCGRTTNEIWGTFQYTYDSPICKAATHDNRISSWNNSQRTVSFIRFSKDIGRYYGSYQQAIRTLDYGNLLTSSNGYYYFTSPRIEEPLLDVTSVSRGFLTSNSEDVIQECHLGGNAKNRLVSFDYFFQFYRGYLSKEGAPDPPPEAPQGIRGGSVSGANQWVTATWKKDTSGFFFPGGLWCIPDSTSYSRVLSLTMDKDAEFRPFLWTITASVEDTVELRMQAFTRSARVTWKKDAATFRPFSPQISVFQKEYFHKLVINNVVPGNRGLYSLQSSDKFPKRGITRLIVRNCKHGIYGPSCEYRCPLCENGGVCHDIMGGCICPPGFNGSLCEFPCGDNYFGATCNRLCSDSNPGREPTCEGLLFCLPDPFGCSCGAGFKGLDCKTKCSPSEFGAGCRLRRECHCEGQESHCNIFTGLCPSGCKPGWRDISCEKSYPYLQSPPRLLRGGGSQDLELQLSPWDQRHGYGRPVAYILEIKKNESESASEVFEVMEQLNYTYQIIMINVSLGNLHPNTWYAVRAVLLDADGGAQRDLAPYNVFRTSCGEPDGPPEDIQVSFSDPRAVRVTWKYPAKSTWNCDSVQVRIEYISPQTSNSTLLSARTQFVFQTEPFTEWRLTARLETPNGKFSNWSEIINGTSAEDAPGQVQSPNLTFNAEDQSLTVSWKEPLKLNGRIRYYELEFYHLQWIHNKDCSHTSVVNRTQVTEKEIVFNNVNFSSIYRVHIYGFTVKQGDQLYRGISTPESEPSGPPLDMVISQVKPRRLMINWSPPQCQLQNGQITGYVVWQEGLSEWDTRITNLTDIKTSAFVSGLTPFSLYQFKVQACTKAGCGESYESLNVTTLSDRPTVPRNLTIYQRTMTTLSFSWQEPRPPQGVITEYRLTYKLKKDTHSTIQNKDDLVCKLPGLSNMYCYNFSSLVPMQVYVIEVSATNSNGTGPTASAEEETDESIPDAPEMVNVTERTVSSATVIWNLPLRQNGKILGYQVNVTMATNEGGIRVIWSRNLTQRTINIPGLTSTTRYNVSVAARTSKGYGPSAVQTFSTRSPTLTIDGPPTLGDIMDNTVVLVIKSVDLQSIPMSAYFVLVKEVLEEEKDSEKGSRRKRRCTYDPKQGKRRRRCSGVASDSDDSKGSVSLDPFPTDYNSSLGQNRHLYVTGKLKPQQVPPEGYPFQVGDGRTYNGYYNAPLATGHVYRFGVAVVSEYPEDPKACASFLKDTVTVRSPEEPPTAPSVALVVGLVIICLLAITAFLLFLYYKKPRLFHSVKDKASSSFHIMNNNKEGGPRSNLNESSYSLELRTDSSPMKGSHSNRVPVADLDSFVREGIESDKIEQEFQSVSKGQLYSNDVARLPENKCKNRYGNLLPYDHSRVVLDKVNNDPFSDYINACLVDGYKGSRKYIATQGPKPITLNDFWRMVWQMNVCKIAMVTNVLENGKVKCEKYWPDTTDRYGQFTIEHKEVNTFTDYVIRTFQVSKSETESREVLQFHFTTWADHQVPMYPMAMGGFLRKLRAYQPESTAPVVVHCSAGVGRTGTLILVDAMMDMAAAENTVDVFSQFWSMRQQRINLVENKDQYVFAYQALAEVLSGVESSIICSDFYKEFTRLKKEDPNTGKSPIAVQFQILETRRHPLKSTDCKNALDPSNADKNRDASIVPPDRSRPVLPAFQPEITSNYINAVYVNGYKQRDQFVVTQMPLPHTVSDFWRMLKSTRTRTIVLLQDGDIEQYWPHEKPVEHGALKVTTTSTEKEGNVIVRQFTIKGPGPKDEVTIKQFHLQNWKTSQEVPSSANMFLDLIQRVERWQKQTGNKPVTVQCLNGASACGVYCATVFVCDKIKSDQEVDVFLAVRSIRRNRPQLITSQEQYMFCYQMAITFLDDFETYANFQ